MFSIFSLTITGFSHCVIIQTVIHTFVNPVQSADSETLDKYFVEFLHSSQLFLDKLNRSIVIHLIILIRGLIKSSLYMRIMNKIAACMYPA